MHSRHRHDDTIPICDAVGVLNRSRIQEVSDGIYAAWNGHLPDAVAAFYAEDAQIVDATSGIVTTGRAALLDVWFGRLRGFPDLALERTALLVEANTSSDMWIMRGTQSGEYDELPASGRAIEISGASLTEYNEQGLVLRDTVYTDVPELLRQLGIE